MCFSTVRNRKLHPKTVKRRPVSTKRKWPQPYICLTMPRVEVLFVGQSETPFSQPPFTWEINTTGVT